MNRYSRMNPNKALPLVLPWTILAVTGLVDAGALTAIAIAIAIWALIPTALIPTALTWAGRRR